MSRVTTSGRTTLNEGTSCLFNDGFLLFLFPFRAFSRIPIFVLSDTPLINSNCHCFTSVLPPRSRPLPRMPRLPRLPRLVRLPCHTHIYGEHSTQSAVGSCSRNFLLNWHFRAPAPYLTAYSPIPFAGRPSLRLLSARPVEPMSASPRSRPASLPLWGRIISEAPVVFPRPSQFLIPVPVVTVLWREARDDGGYLVSVARSPTEDAVDR